MAHDGTVRTDLSADAIDVPPEYLSGPQRPELGASGSN
jgi:hypothetical protein